MVEKLKTPRVSKITQSTSRAHTQTPKDGPVSLQEARALATTSTTHRAPKKSTRRRFSPEPIGIARERFRRDYLREIKLRAEEYEAVFSVMQKRGVKAANKKRGGTPMKPGFKDEAFAPLKILAEGDSWFDYPAFIKGGIIPRLEELLGVPILSLAKAGDEVRYMLGVEQRKLLSSYLYYGSGTSGKFDALLFSGGGNDIVGDPMAIWINNWDPKISPEKHINSQHYGSALALVQAGYEELIVLRDSLSPNTHIFFHVYDYAIPNGKGICHLGPWLKPALDLRGFPELPQDPRKIPQSARFRVVKEMLRQFAVMLNTLIANQPKDSKISLIPTQGKLVPVVNSWHNELHPSSEGYDLFTEIFKVEINKVFPGRVSA